MTWSALDGDLMASTSGGFSVSLAIELSGISHKRQEVWNISSHFIIVSGNGYSLNKKINLLRIVQNSVLPPTAETLLSLMKWATVPSDQSKLFRYLPHKREKLDFKNPFRRLNNEFLLLLFLLICFEEYSYKTD